MSAIVYYNIQHCSFLMGFLLARMVKNLPALQEIWVWSHGRVSWWLHDEVSVIFFYIKHYNTCLGNVIPTYLGNKERYLEAISIVDLALVYSSFQIQRITY